MHTNNTKWSSRLHEHINLTKIRCRTQCYERAFIKQTRLALRTVITISRFIKSDLNKNALKLYRFAFFVFSIWQWYTSSLYLQGFVQVFRYADQSTKDIRYLFFDPRREIPSATFFKYPICCSSLSARYSTIKRFTRILFNTLRDQREHTETDNGFFSNCKNSDAGCETTSRQRLVFSLYLKPNHLTT